MAQLSTLGHGVCQVSTEIRTADKQEIAKFVLDHADDLKDKAIEIRRKGEQLSAEMFSTDEPTP